MHSHLNKQKTGTTTSNSKQFKSNTYIQIHAFMRTNRKKTNTLTLQINNEKK